jgi:hypothetical protein
VLRIHLSTKKLNLSFEASKDLCSNHAPSTTDEIKNLEIRDFKERIKMQIAKRRNIYLNMIYKIFGIVILITVLCSKGCFLLIRSNNILLKYNIS